MSSQVYNLGVFDLQLHTCNPQKGDVVEKVHPRAFFLRDAANPYPESEYSPMV